MTDPEINEIAKDLDWGDKVIRPKPGQFDEELIRKWIEVLRHGDYHQGQLTLVFVDRTNFAEPTPRFCCLGVLCDIVDPDGWTEDWDNIADGEAVPFKYGENETTMGLPYELAKQVAFLTNIEKEFEGAIPADFFAPYLRKSESMPNNYFGSLGTLNDGGASFDLIADIIEDWFFGDRGGDQ